MSSIQFTANEKSLVVYGIRCRVQCDNIYEVSCFTADLINCGRKSNAQDMLQSPRCTQCRGLKLCLRESLPSVSFGVMNPKTEFVLATTECRTLGTLFESLTNDMSGSLILKIRI